MGQEIVDGLTIAKRLEGSEFGLHNCRLEGLELPSEEQEILRSWIRQGLTVEEMIARVKAEYASLSEGAQGE